MRAKFQRKDKSMSDVKWIKFDKTFFDDPIIKIMMNYNQDCVLVYIQMILKSTQIENENYGYINRYLGTFEITNEIFANFWETNAETVNKTFEFLQKYGLLEIEKKRLKVYYPWESDHTRNSVMYQKWKRDVMNRDFNKCSVCGSKEDLEVHHIVAWRFCKDDDELRYDINNGMTLCHTCHFKKHNGNWRN